MKQGTQEVFMVNEGTVFSNRVVPMDNVRFVRCRFIGVTLLYSGGPWQLVECQFENCELIFQGAAHFCVQLFLFLQKREANLRFASRGSVVH